MHVDNKKTQRAALDCHGLQVFFKAVWRDSLLPSHFSRKTRTFQKSRSWAEVSFLVFLPLTVIIPLHKRGIIMMEAQMKPSICWPTPRQPVWILLGSLVNFTFCLCGFSWRLRSNLPLSSSNGKEEPIRSFAFQGCVSCVIREYENYLIGLLRNDFLLSFLYEDFLYFFHLSWTLRG